jgi:putative ABC transport system substrate-binding protein
MKVVGFLNSGSKARFGPLVTAFVEGLREEGFTEGQDVKIRFGFANGNFKKLDTLARGLVKTRGAATDVLVATGGVVAAQAALNAAGKVPVVFLGGLDPARIKSKKRSKRGDRALANATGTSLSTTMSVPERLEHLRGFASQAATIGVLLHYGTDVFERELKQAKKAKLAVFAVKKASELRSAFVAARKAGIDALMVCANPSFMNQRDKIVALAAEFKLPTVYPMREYVEAGGLISFGPNLRNAYHQIGKDTGTVLRGEKPNKVPKRRTETSNFELVINGRTAETLGISISDALRQRAEVL